MPRAYYIAIIVSLGLCSNSYALGKGDKAPDFSLPGVHGVVNLSANAGEVIYLDFWASWCGPSVFRLDKPDAGKIQIKRI